jgi:hypothetical protein
MRKLFPFFSIFRLEQNSSISGISLPTVEPSTYGSSYVERPTACGVLD